MKRRLKRWCGGRRIVRRMKMRRSEWKRGGGREGGGRGGEHLLRLSKRNTGDKMFQCSEGDGFISLQWRKLLLDT